MPAPGSRFEFPEWSWDTQSQHRLLTAQRSGVAPAASGCAQGAICGAAWEGEGEKLGYLVRAGCQAGSDRAEQECVDTWDQGTKLTSHPSLLRAVRSGNVIEAPALGPPKGSSGQGQPAETQSSDVIIGKCSNQGTGGSELYATHPRSLSPSQQQSWVPDAAMGSRLLCCVTLCLLGAGESWTQCGSF